LDIKFNTIIDPVLMETELNKIPGVAENGFFTRIRPVVYIARPTGIDIRK